VRFISRFEHDLFEHARSRDCDGVICGHIHSPNVVNFGEVAYLNTGDWVENCTALIEFHDGTMHLESHYPTVAPRLVPTGRTMQPWTAPQNRLSPPGGLTLQAKTSVA
jgi:hypothetical protein